MTQYGVMTPSTEAVMSIGVIRCDLTRIGTKHSSIIIPTALTRLSKPSSKRNDEIITNATNTVRGAATHMGMACSPKNPCRSVSAISDTANTHEARNIATVRMPDEAPWMSYFNPTR